MIINLMVEVDLKEKDKRLSEERLYDFVEDQLENGFSTRFELLSAGVLDRISLSSCNLPLDLINCLNLYQLNYLCDMQRYGYFQIYDIIYKHHPNQIGKYIDSLHRAMKKHEINHYDIALSSLIPLNSCGLNARIVNSLTHRGYRYLQDITHFTRKRIAETRNLGFMSMRDLDQKLLEHGLCYADDTDDKKIIF